MGKAQVHRANLYYYGKAKTLYSLANLSHEEKLIIVQHVINKYDSEVVLKDKLKDVIPPKELERLLDTLIATQKVRRIGAETLQNNVTHIGELPEIPQNLSELVAHI